MEALDDMGVLREDSTGSVHVLESHHLIGRSHRCSLRLVEPSVSGEHASLRWTGGCWVIKDLGSRYGTFMDSAPLQPGIPITIKKGARLAFGRGKQTWQFVEDGPPEVMVLPEGGGPALTRSDGMIAIPSVENPAAVVFQSMDGRWMLDQAGHVDSIEEHVAFLVDGTRWRLANATPAQQTSRAGDPGDLMALSEVHLHFLVSRNEEHVEIGVQWRGRVVNLDPRSHNYLLLTLARMRRRDIENGETPAAAGWVDQDELARLLQLGPERLNLDIFRARRQFGAEGFMPPAGIVERRPAARDLRIGVSAIEIEVA
jgi:hypothetical protein